jgi:hypothetical protein
VHILYARNICPTCTCHGCLHGVSSSVCALTWPWAHGRDLYSITTPQQQAITVTTNQQQQQLNNAATTQHATTGNYDDDHAITGMQQPHAENIHAPTHMAQIVRLTDRMAWRTQQPCSTINYNTSANDERRRMQTNSPWNIISPVLGHVNFGFVASCSRLLTCGVCLMQLKVASKTVSIACMLLSIAHCAYNCA